MSRVLVLGKKAVPLLEKVGGIDDRMLKTMIFERFDVQGNQADTRQKGSLEAALRGSQPSGYRA